MFLSEYPMATKGVNLYVDVLSVQKDECMLSQNMIWKNGMVKRQGMQKFNSSEVSAGKKILGLHRFYYGDGSKQLVVSSGTNVKYYDDNTQTWIAIDSSRTDNKTTNFTTWGGVDKLFIANGTDVPLSWDGSTKANVTTAPSKTIQFLPYQDRLLSIDNNNPGNLRWSASFDETASWETAANCGIKPDTKLYGMIIHSTSNTTSGFESKVLLAGANGMYIFSGSNLTTPFTAGDYVINQVSTNTGCNAPKTMVWTPKGTIYLGVDGQVYILPFDSIIPIPIGHKIISNSFSPGIENLPAAHISNACAVYYKGYYILSITPNGGSINNVQWWLDVNRLQIDRNGFWGPWYGPMKGQTISSFLIMSGAGDSGELLGGEMDSSIGSYVYNLDKQDIYTDDGNPITVSYQTFYNGMGNNFKDKRVKSLEVEALDSITGATFSFIDSTKGISGGEQISIESEANYWGDKKWNQDWWTGSGTIPVRDKTDLINTIDARRLSIKIDHSSPDFVQLNSIRASGKVKRRVFSKE
ncbi:MAG: hypothetical protein ACE5GU_13735 [Candidatus Scalinduaceae bacterium]